MTEQITSPEQRERLAAEKMEPVSKMSEVETWDSDDFGVIYGPNLSPVLSAHTDVLDYERIVRVASIFGISPPGYVLVPEERMKELEGAEKALAGLKSFTGVTIAEMEMVTDRPYSADDLRASIRRWANLMEIACTGPKEAETHG